MSNFGIQDVHFLLYRDFYRCGLRGCKVLQKTRSQQKYYLRDVHVQVCVGAGEYTGNIVVKVKVLQLSKDFTIAQLCKSL